MHSVTFVMPTINDEFFDKAVNSIFWQSITSWELLVYNNSPKRKIDIKDKRVKVFNTPNWQITKCFNHAHTISESNIILHQSDDDISFPHRAEITYNEICKGADLFFGSYIAINEKGQLRYYFHTPDFDAEFVRKRGCCMPLLVGGYVKNKVPMYREDFPLLHDYTFIWDCYLKGLRFVASPTPLGFRTLRDKSYQSSNYFIKEKETERLRKLYNDDKMRSERETTYL